MSATSGDASDAAVDGKAVNEFQSRLSGRSGSAIVSNDARLICFKGKAQATYYAAGYEYYLRGTLGSEDERDRTEDFALWLSPETFSVLHR